ncbi:YraN family protein [Patescibacteria group bacterium]|nr:YraN family protein [Patescibacteria group bacterium]
MKRSSTKVVGALGEKTALKYLQSKGYSFVERNFLRKCGEIDLIVKKDKILHFVEVKTVSRENLENVTRENIRMDCFRPEDNVHRWKLERMARVIQVYLVEKNVSEEQEWRFDVITVLLDIKNKVAKVEMLEDIILQSA